VIFLLKKHPKVTGEMRNCHPSWKPKKWNGVIITLCDEFFYRYLF
jgi:hypothetical protein